jgi:hypothetical protein
LFTFHLKEHGTGFGERGLGFGGGAEWQPVQHRGAGKQLYQVRPEVGLFRHRPAQRAHYETGKRVFAGFAGTSGTVNGPV